MRALIEPLVSNGYTLEMTPERLGWLEPTNPDLPIEQLREKYQQKGYLWLKGFFEREVVLNFQQYFFASIFARGPQAFLEVIGSQEYEDFCTMPRLWNFYQEFLQGQPYLHKRKLLRFNHPGEVNCTGGHYDLIFCGQEPTGFRPAGFRLAIPQLKWEV